MYKINEIASQFGITSNTLRFYEKKGPLHPTREKNGYRLYTTEDTAAIQTILLFRSMGFSIDMISCFLKQKAEPLTMFMNQYQLLNRHIHDMGLIRDSLEQCIELLFQENDYTDELKEQMKETSRILSDSSDWTDRWDFNDWAVSYDEDIRLPHNGLDFYSQYDKILTRTAELVNEQQGIVAEIGVGTGALAGRLLDTQNIIGVDQSVTMLKEAKRKYPGLPVKVGTFLQLPFKDQSVETIVTSYAFHHNNDTERPLALREMKRVLKPGGRIIITDLMFADSEAYDKFAATCSPEEYKDLKDEYFTTVEELEMLMTALGYKCSHEQIDNLIWIVIARQS